MSSGRRIRPERAPAHRRNVQKLTWRNSHWLHSFPEEQRVASMTIADMSPALASRRVVLLCERQQYREAANLVTRLGQATFKAILPELPVEVFLDAVPQSLHLLEALYAKVFLSEGLNFSLKLLKPEALVFQMVRLFAQHADDSGFEQDYTRNRFVAAPVMLSSCKKLLKVIVLTEPRMRHQLSGRKKALERALEGLGQHGLVGASGGVLVHLHDALRAELDLLLHQLKVSAQKLDALAAQGPQRVSLSHGPAPTTASHHRQLSMRQGQVQERLIKNKTLLNALEPVDQAGLEGLLAVLRRRIQLDKDVLFQFTQLRKESPDLDEGTVVAPVLLRYSTGCHHVLDLMRDVGADDEDDSDLSAGYHSDSDQSAMTRPADAHSTASSSGAESGELARARQAILVLQQRQRELQDRLASQAQKMIERSPRFENLAHCERRPTVLIRRYGSLYAQARVDTLDALDALPQLRDADELKTKLLFSVVVLGFRSVQSGVAEIKSQVRRLLQIPAQSSEPRVKELEASVEDYLRSTVDAFDVSRHVDEVCAQIWATLYDYPCLKGCQGLARYVRDCVRLAWALTVQGFGIEYETRVFRRDLHVRFHTSNHESDHIRTYLWPALLRAAPQGACVHKGVVVT